MAEGGCFCGAVRYRVGAEPVSSGICHCRTCRKIASSPASPFVEFPADAFTFTRGEPIEFHSSPPVTRTLCGRCGSPLTYRNDNAPGRVDVMTCSLDNPEAFPPEFHVWAGDKLAWEVVSDELPAFKTTRTEGQQI
jgi:hypothetical protein